MRDELVIRGRLPFPNASASSSKASRRGMRVGRLNEAIIFIINWLHKYA